jgi:hypothetical protein
MSETNYSIEEVVRKEPYTVPPAKRRELGIWLNILLFVLKFFSTTMGSTMA